MDGIDRKKVDRRDRHAIRKAGSISIRQQIQTTRSKMQTELDLLMFGGEGSNSAVLGGFSGVEGGMGMEERVAVGMGRMAERMEALETRVAELEAQLSEKKTVAVVSTPVSTPVKKAEKVVTAQIAAPAAPVKKGKTAAAPVAAAPLDAPTPASYRLSPSVVAAHTKCQARKEPPQGGAGTGWDKRFTPSVFWERLCQSEPETDGLCTTCLRYRDQNPKKWHGLITEEPLPESHMLGTAWAEKKCKWTGSATGSVSAPVSSAASVASEASEEEGSAVVLTPAPVSAATVAPMDPAQTAAAQAKKEAAAAKRKATIAKKKEAAAATPAPVAAVAVVTLGTAAVTTAVVAAVSTTEPVADAGELKLLQGEFYWVVGSNAYEYDQIEEKPGAFAGLVRADETIDGDAEEEGAAESDGE